jgi:hypothetical protein
MKKLILAAAFAALAFGAAAAQAAPGSIVEARRGGYNYGPGGDYYMQQYPGPNCYSQPHPMYGWICY